MLSKSACACSPRIHRKQLRIQNGLYLSFEPEFSMLLPSSATHKAFSSSPGCRFCFSSSWFLNCELTSFYRRYKEELRRKGDNGASRHTRPTRRERYNRPPGPGRDEWDEGNTWRCWYRHRWPKRRRRCDFPVKMSQRHFLLEW